MFKLGTVIFLITTVVFAGLYFTEKQHKPGNIVEVREIVKVVKSRNAETPYEKEKIKRSESRDGQLVSRVVTPEISRHSELSDLEVRIMTKAYDDMRSRWSEKSKWSHPILYKKLNLDEETEKKFLTLIGERRMALYMKAPGKGSDEEEKEEHQVYKEDVLNYVDDKIQALIGDQSDVYFDYREKSQQYRSVTGINKSLEKSGIAMNEEEQDQLAQVLFDNRRELDSNYASYDWSAVRKNSERIDEVLEFHTKRYDAMKEQASFLSDKQQEAFDKHLNRYLSEYKRYAERRSRER